MQFVGLGIVVGAVLACADERRFAYVYEPETSPAGALEYENWVTLRSQRTGAVGQDDYNAWELRQELEYGVTDAYTVALYLNEKATAYRTPGTTDSTSEFAWEGLSLENRFNVLNPADHPVGLSLYLEGAYSGSEAALEQKIILGQRHGDWKWALNLGHETEWEDDLHEVEAEVSASFGLARDVSRQWSLGLELRNENVFPAYDTWENSAIFLGPTVSWRHDKWYAVLAVQPQILGWNGGGDPDQSRHLDLSHHERLNVRLLLGFDL